MDELARQTIERVAERFLAGVPAYLWDGESLPVPVEDIADSHVGLLVRDVEDLNQAPGAPPADSRQALSGLLLPAIGEIWVNAAEARRWPARRRFTIAHELGHWSLHRDGEQPAFCRSGAVDPDGERPPAPPAEHGPAPPAERPPIPPAEEQANAFAAAVLMPARLVRDQYARLGRDLDALCAAFSASGAAMSRRLQAVIGQRPTYR
ncbi:MAG TPA: ImmA/IrrE family metallo-endopeptidase [Solirubrobacteraceae bacterium]|nr:ImmA/IrrE family metallo-endopeptidase [Solirubrobacteraceae bacterium]